MSLRTFLIYGGGRYTRFLSLCHRLAAPGVASAGAMGPSKRKCYQSDGKRSWNEVSRVESKAGGPNHGGWVCTLANGQIAEEGIVTGLTVEAGVYRRQGIQQGRWTDGRGRIARSWWRRQEGHQEEVVMTGGRVKVRGWNVRKLGSAGARSQDPMVKWQAFVDTWERRKWEVVLLTDIYSRHMDTATERDMGTSEMAHTPSDRIEGVGRGCGGWGGRS